MQSSKSIVGVQFLYRQCKGATVLLDKGYAEGPQGGDPDLGLPSLCLRALLLALARSFSTKVAASPTRTAKSSSRT